MNSMTNNYSSYSGSLLPQVNAVPSPALALTVGSGEKPVPFLKSLIEMIVNHQDLISFVPGERSDAGEVTTQAQIIIRDRNQLSDVLPLYFSHASFASLRRQLSYFSFVRNTKGRQPNNVTYINEKVAELADILRLKRKISVAGGNSPPPGSLQTTQVAQRQEKQPGGSQMQEQPASDVALAVSSGRMHAFEANEDLEMNLDADTSKSISSITMVTKHGALVSSKKRSKKKKNKRANMTSEECLRRKKRQDAKHRRTQKLLYINTLVPFINLPPTQMSKTNFEEGDMEKIFPQQSTVMVRSKSSSD